MKIALVIDEKVVNVIVGEADVLPLLQKQYDAAVALTDDGGIGIGWRYDMATAVFLPPEGYTAPTLGDIKRERIARIKDEAEALIAATDWKLARAQEREAAGWGTMADIDAVLAEREAVRQSSSVAEARVLDLESAEAVKAFAWEVDFAVPVPMRVTKKGFMDLFTDAEVAAILAEPRIQGWWTKFTLSDFVSLANAEVRDGVKGLALFGLIAADRVTQILDGQVPGGNA